MVETGAYDRPALDRMPLVIPPILTPPLLVPPNVVAFYLHSGPQLEIWRQYLEAIRIDLNATATSESFADGRWNLPGQLNYIKKHICGGQTPRADGTCP